VRHFVQEYRVSQRRTRIIRFLANVYIVSTGQSDRSRFAQYFLVLSAVVYRNYRQVIIPEYPRKAGLYNIFNRMGNLRPACMLGMPPVVPGFRKLHAA
jgi:hypothetical protein